MQSWNIFFLFCEILIPNYFSDVLKDLFTARVHVLVIKTFPIRIYEKVYSSILYQSILIVSKKVYTSFVYINKIF